MQIIKRAAQAAAVGALGLGGVLALAGASGAATPAVQSPTVITTTSVLESSQSEGGGLTVDTYNEYVPSAAAPGYTLYATMNEVCTGAIAPSTLCTWRMHVNGQHEGLIGNLVFTATGRVGNVQNGTGNFARAKGLFSSQNIAPGVGTDTFVFTT